MYRWRPRCRRYGYWWNADEHRRDADEHRWGADEHWRDADEHRRDADEHRWSADEHRRGRRNHAHRLWCLMSLELSLRALETGSR